MFLSYAIHYLGCTQIGTVGFFPGAILVFLIVVILEAAILRDLAHISSVRAYGISILMNYVTYAIVPSIAWLIQMATSSVVSILAILQLAMLSIAVLSIRGMRRSIIKKIVAIAAFADFIWCVASGGVLYPPAIAVGIGRSCLDVLFYLLLLFCIFISIEYWIASIFVKVENLDRIILAANAASVVFVSVSMSSVIIVPVLLAAW